MYNYHHDLVATHPYSSMWYTWPITKQSVLYWVGTTKTGAITRIALLGNPAIWWFSIPCMIFVLIAAIKTRKFEYWFLIIPIVSIMASYVGIERIMFLYVILFIVFIIFYPIYSGFPTSQEYIKELQWLKTWIW